MPPEIDTKKKPPKPFKVWLGNATSYKQARLEVLVGEALEAMEFWPASGSKVLVKPNLLCADPGGLACTNPAIVRAACLYLLDYNCKISVSDSPGFGRAASVAEKTGLSQALGSLPGGGLKVSEMGPCAKRRLSQGGHIGVAIRALEADIILNLPKLKAHRMMRVSGAVKNLFGCISGVQKAMLHSRYGDKQRNGVPAFASLIADLCNLLPSSVVLLDGSTAMHKSGPIKGEAIQSGLLLSANSSVAADTALYTLLGQAPEFFPIWQELQRRGTAGAFAHELAWHGLDKNNLDLSAFQLPLTLGSESFNPFRLCLSALKRMAAYLHK